MKYILPILLLFSMGCTYGGKVRYDTKDENVLIQELVAVGVYRFKDGNTTCYTYRDGISCVKE